MSVVSAHPGHASAARHGAHPPRLVEPPRARTIEEELLRLSEFTATQRIAVREVARCTSILDAIDRDLDERVLVDQPIRTVEGRSHRIGVEVV